MCTDQKIRNKYDGFSIGFAGLEMGKTQTIIALRPPFEALKRTVANRSTDRIPSFEVLIFINGLELQEY